VPLAEAIERLEQLTRGQRGGHFGHALTREDFVTAWQRPMATKSSAFDQTIAALSQYGLLARTFEDGKSWRLSDLARGILRSKDSDDRALLLREAALKPQVFRELWELSADAGLDRTALIAYLVAGREQRGQAPFTRRAAENLLRIFDETMRYARLRPVEPAGDDWTTEHITDEAGQAILIRYRGKPCRERYEFIRDFLDLKVRRLRESEAH
jgi:hypothetical protein